MKDLYVDVRVRIKGNFEDNCFHNLEYALQLGDHVVHVIDEHADDRDIVGADVIHVGLEDTLKFEIPERFLDCE